MALKGLDIFKLSPKKNCKECGCPTCMAFCMKVAQGALPLEKCPYFAPDAVAKLSEATAPPMKTLEVGTGANAHKLGGETVLFRHEKTLVSKNLFAVNLCTCMSPEEIDAKIAEMKQVDYERIGERMFVEFLFCSYVGNGVDKYVELVKKAVAADRAIVLECWDVEAAKAALEVCKDTKPILDGCTPENWEAMNGLAQEYGVTLGLYAENLSDLYDLVKKLEEPGTRT